MHAPEKMSAVIGGLRYSVETATLLAGDDWWDGHNHERRGTNTFLYRTPNGSFFFVNLSQWQGSPGSQIVPCQRDEAVSFWESCQAHDSCEVKTFEEAFPGIEIRDA